MWLMVQFDLPVDTKPQRRVYAHFRKRLLSLGFRCLQKSVYARWEDRDDTADTTAGRIEEDLPADGVVSLFRLTDRTMQTASFYENGYVVPPPQAPTSLLLF